MKKTIFALLVAAFTLSASAYDVYYVPGANPTYQFNVIFPGEYTYISGERQTSTFEIPQDYVYPLLLSATNWNEKINLAPGTPLQYYYYSIDEYNAMAGSYPVKVDGMLYKYVQTCARLNGWNYTPDDDRSLIGDAIVMVGLGINEKYSGWQPYTGKHGLYHGELPDLYAVMNHEMMHSLGVTSNAYQYYGDSDNPATDQKYYFSENANDPLSIFDAQLRIYKHNAAPVTVGDLNAYEAAPRSGQAIGTGAGQYNLTDHSPYFVGENTIKVLGDSDDYDTARQNIIDNGGFVNYSVSYDNDEHPEQSVYPTVYGMPIHPADDDEYDLSHLELKNSYMSHQEYRNWLVPMEAELAVMNDIGYNIVLRKYFGKSYYLSNQDVEYADGFSEWNGAAYTGNPSLIDQAVGVHIYGDNNIITQTTNAIKTNGEGSFGVRIDGVGNTYTLAGGNIYANGKENYGIAVTWGKGHTVNVNNGTEVTATGEDGIAVSFDFGANLFGTKSSNVKGSYINYIQGEDIWTSGDIIPEEATQGALVSDFNVNGTLTGSKAAIYISDNAYVDNINIGDGAEINGDIISEWNSITSAGKAKVLSDNGGEWHPVNPFFDGLYYTKLNFNAPGGVDVNGNITGETGLSNTLKMNNALGSTINFNGDKIAVNSLNNLGVINIVDAVIYAQDGRINGNGSLNVAADGKLSFSPLLSVVDNTVNMGNGSELSTMNELASGLYIEELNTGDDVSMSFDLDDALGFTNVTGTGTAKINQILVDEDTAKTLQDGDTYDLFATAETLALTGASNAYYNGNKYTISQSATDNTKLEVALTATGVELSDAVEDPTTPNYIVTEDALTKDAGTVAGDNFTISGNDIDVNGHNGLVIDGAANKNGTTLKTGIAGASNANITVQNDGKLTVTAQDKDIVLGEEGQVALNVEDSEVKLDASENLIEVQGAITGTGADVADNKLAFTGNEISIGEVGNVTVNSTAKTVNLYGTSADSVLNMNNTVFNVEKDLYLASNGTNTLNMNNSVLNLTNNKTTDINLAGMNLASNNKLLIDVDLKNLTSDRLVFQNAADLDVSPETSVVIQNANLLNSNLTFTDKKYYIPFVSDEYNNQNLINRVTFNERNMMTPIFKYNLSYAEDGNQGGFLFSRGASRVYNSYNPAVTVSPVAAQLGGYLNQLNSYEHAFQNVDMKMLMTREERQAYKMANLYASTVTPTRYSPTYLPEKDAGAWFRPYATFEKVGLSNGPKVENISYGSYFGGDSPMYETKNGWDYQYSIYAGYNGSHQNYAGNSIYQNGGNLGATAIWYKNDFFTALTANVGAGVADASTMFGSEDITMLMSGIASKTGYNWELARGKFIIQPSYLMSYSFVNTFDYTNAAGVRIKSDPLNAINIVPGIKFIGNLKNGWQPYVGMQMVWNIMDKTDFRANNVALPYMSVKPYFQYGVGVQKRWGDRFTGFFQTMIRNGGRNGVDLSLGFRWALGK